jgi:hypothetical protein
MDGQWSAASSPVLCHEPMCEDSPRHPLIPPESTMNAVHLDIAAVAEAAYGATTAAAAFTVPGQPQPLAELTVAQLEWVGGAGASNSFY